jgi:hypothetical protein
MVLLEVVHDGSGDDAINDVTPRRSNDVDDDGR